MSVLRGLLVVMVLAGIALGGWYTWMHRPATIPALPVALEQEHTLGGTVSTTTTLSLTIISVNPGHEGEEVTLKIGPRTSIFRFVQTGSGTEHSPASMSDLSTTTQVSVLYTADTAESIGILSQ